MTLTVLGSGTSHGVPVIGCDCEVCRSPDPRNTRSRASVMITEGNSRIVIDTGPDFRQQMLRERVKDLDAVFVTHDHADHLNGIDDLRIFSRYNPLPLFAKTEVIDELKKRFSYIFTREVPGGGIPRLDTRSLDSAPVIVGDITMQPVPIQHGCQAILGYRAGRAAYLTDCSAIPESSYPLLGGLDVLIIGALRYRQHPTHFSIGEAVEAARRIGARQTYLTHLCHDAEHSMLAKSLPEGVMPAYDGLVLEL